MAPKEIADDVEYLHKLDARLPSGHLLSANGQDIIKSGGRQRKNRYIFQLPGIFMPQGVAGQIGSLEKMNSSEPIMYLDLDQDRRLRLKGRVVTSESSWMLLRVQSSNVGCKDVYDRVVIFDCAEIINKDDQIIEPTAEEISDHDKEVEGEKEDDFEFGLSAIARPKDIKKKGKRSTTVSKESKQKESSSGKRRRLLDDLPIDDDDDDILPFDPIPLPPSRRPRRSTTCKVRTYKEDDDDVSRSNDDDEEPPSSVTVTKKSNLSSKRRTTPTDIIEIDDDDDENDEIELEYDADDINKDDESIDDDDDDDEDWGE